MSDANMTTGYAKSFKDLRVYQEAREVSRAVFNLSKAFPKEEMFSLTDQVRRAARSIGAQIAEAWGKRRYEKHFVSKLTDADAEQMEPQHWIGEAFDCGYISEADAGRLPLGTRRSRPDAALDDGKSGFLLRPAGWNGPGTRRRILHRGTDR